MPWDRGVFRLGAEPPRPRRPEPRRGRPVDPETVERVRALWEGSWLRPDAIAARADVSLGAVYAWARNAGWTRPPFAPLPGPSKRPPSPRRLGAERAEAAALRILGELEADAAVDLPGLSGVMVLLDGARELRRRSRRAAPSRAAPDRARPRPAGTTAPSPR